LPEAEKGLNPNDENYTRSVRTIFSPEALGSIWAVVIPPILGRVNRVTQPFGRARSPAAFRPAIEIRISAAGVEFIAENGGGPGVRLRKGSPK
jgi:hypothetical protein